MSTSIKLQIEELASLRGQREYAVDCLVNRIDEMEDSEVREYLEVKTGLDSEINFLENHLKNVA